MRTTSPSITSAVAAALFTCATFIGGCDGGDDGTTDGTADESTDVGDGESSGGETAGGDAPFNATATLDGAAFSFACGPEFNAGEGNVKMYVEQIDAYSIVCRSTDGTTQIKLGFAAPAVGTTAFTANDAGVQIGDIMDITPLTPATPNAIKNEITFESVDAGVALTGSFSAEWDASAGEPAATVNGTFDLTF